LYIPTIKGARISHKAIWNVINSERKYFQLNSNDVCALTYPLHTIQSANQIYSAILTGCTITVFRRQDLAEMENFIKCPPVNKLTKLILMYHDFDNFLTSIEPLGKKETKKTLKSLKLVICEGALLPRHAVNNAKRLFKTKEQMSALHMRNFTGLAD